MKVYTKKGDTGETSLFGGERVKKSHLRIESYGTVDELNAHIGFLRDQPILDVHRSFLTEIQNQLFTIGSHLATTKEKSASSLPEIKESFIYDLEKEIDRQEDQLEPLKSFILPGGHEIVSFAHIVRCVCRRAERSVVRLSELELVNEIIIKYLNRLSDYFFVLSRSLAKELNAKELKWTPRV